MRPTTTLLLLLFCLSAAPAAAQHTLQGAAQPASAEIAAIESLRADLDSLLADSAFTRTMAAVEISECGTGRVFYRRNSGLLLRTASLAKLFTLATAVGTLPADAAFSTTVHIRIRSGGAASVWIRGGGDPLFGGEDIEKIASMLRGAGIQRVDTLGFDASLFRPGPWGPGWTWDDQFDASFPFLSPFPFERNRIRCTVVGDTQGTGAPRLTWYPSSPLFHVRSMISLGDTTDLAATRQEGTNAVLLTGTILRGDSDHISMSIWDPESVIRRSFRDALRANGLADSSVLCVSAPLPQGFTFLGARRHAVADVLPLVGKNSDNTCAEMLLRRIAATEQDTGITAEDGLVQVRRRAAMLGVPESQLRLVDGSGLSQYDLASASAVGTLLRGLAGGAEYSRFRRALAVAGTDGTLARRMSDAAVRGRFTGKTGTMGGVSNLAGYAEGPDGRPLVVVIMMQNFTGSLRPWREAQDALVRRVLAFAAARGVTRVR